jgi:hypothetical protein
MTPDVPSFRSVSAGWQETVDFFRDLRHFDGAGPTAELLRRAEKRWADQVVPRTSMADLLFTLPSESFPWSTVVRVSWSPTAFEFQLSRDGLLITADRATDAHASEVLDAFLLQLTARQADAAED